VQNSATLRNAVRTGLPLAGSEKHAAQRPEKLRKKPCLNYKSAALSGRTAGCKHYERAELTVYFSAGGELPKFVRLARREFVNS